jgi:hypothetical protein
MSPTQAQTTPAPLSADVYSESIIGIAYGGQVDDGTPRLSSVYATER